jgi:DNA primase large subunit
MGIHSRRDNSERTNSGDSSTQGEYKSLVISLEGTNLDIDSFAEKYFPPCIRLGLKGLSDGRKRFLFILVNFLKSIGWNSKDITDAVHKWNSRNKDPLSSQMIDAHLKYHLAKKSKAAPPNCISKGYYSDFGICKPDETCSLVKNPLNYAQIMLKRTKGEQKKKKKARQKNHTSEKNDKANSD